MLDPAQYTKADTKMVWVYELADTPDGMLARGGRQMLGRFPGSGDHPLSAGSGPTPST